MAITVELHIISAFRKRNTDSMSGLYFKAADEDKLAVEHHLLRLYLDERECLTSLKRNRNRMLQQKVSCVRLPLEADFFLQI